MPPCSVCNVLSQATQTLVCQRLDVKEGMPAAAR